MEKIDILKMVPIFWGLSEKSLYDIAEKMVTRTYKKGQYIIAEDDEGQSSYFISEGSVKITRTSDDGREVILAMQGVGDFFGEMAMLDDEPRSANIVAISACTVLTLNGADFFGILESHPKVAINLLKELAVRIRKSDEQIEGLSLSDAEKRIAMTLLRISEELGTIYHGDVLVKKMPVQQDIANMAGTSRETVSRTINILEEKGYLKRDGKELTIIDFSRFGRELI
ncbi:MAG: Crp/Fnr family transcriptional regulator [Candidatus Marinimicrobia bacterium]|nr:Crp/Fnr family transcriptional regulator [Candidatus Neomarinimicrobiota bacterium]